MSHPSHPTASPRGRGRPREFDVDRALDGAISVFSESGYHATSLGSLTRAMDIAEGSLYKAFTDKRGVFIAAFERYLTLRNARLSRELAAASTGRDKVKALLTVYAEASSGKQGQRGCLVVGSAVDLASTDADIAKRVSQQFAALEKRLVGFVEEGQTDGSISARVEAAALGRLLLCVAQGMRVVGKTGRSGSEMTSLVDGALALLT